MGHVIVFVGIDEVRFRFFGVVFSFGRYVISTPEDRVFGGIVFLVRSKLGFAFIGIGFGVAEVFEAGVI